MQRLVHAILDRLIAAREFIAELQRARNRTAVLRERDLGLRFVGGDAEQRDLLEGRLESVRLELRGDVVRGQGVAARSGTAAFQQIAGQKLHVRADRVRVEAGGESRSEEKKSAQHRKMHEHNRNRRKVHAP